MYDKTDEYYEDKDNHEYILFSDIEQIELYNNYLHYFNYMSCAGATC